MPGEVTAPRAEEHLGLVHLCANRFRNRGIEYDELYSAGCVGLLKAIKAFDCGRGVQFSTYAVPVILGEIKRLFRDGGIVHVSRSLRERAMKLQKLQEEFEQRYGRSPTMTELSVLLVVLVSGEGKWRLCDAQRLAARFDGLTAALA